MDLGVAGRAAFITGASRGIGAATARALAAEGARVAVCARGAAELEALVGELGGAAAGHHALAIDLTESGTAQKAVAWLAETMGDVDIVVHNLGGTLGMREPLAAAADWERVFHFNLGIAIDLNAGLVPPMRERRYGRIIAISSLAAFEHQGASIPYSVAKAALTAYIRGIGRTYAPDGIVISAVVPGVVLSEGNTWDQLTRRDPAAAKRYLEQVPRGQFGSPEEVAQAVAFLAGRHADPFAGSIVPLEGGQGRSFFGQ